MKDILLKRHRVSSLKDITRDMLKTDDFRIINNDLSIEAKELIADASAEADEALEPIVVSINYPLFKQSCLQRRGEDELMVIGRMYGQFGREIDITKEGVVVHPRTALQHTKKFKDKQQASLATA